MSSDVAARRIHLLSGLLLLGTFLAGALAATGVVFALHGHGHPRPPEGRPPLPRQFQELGLSASQQLQAEAIFERHRPELDAVLQESYPRIRAVNERMESELRSILTPEQVQQLERLEARRPPGSGFPGGRPGAGPPPPPPPGGPPPSRP
jgi:hypothetical protein